LGLGATAVQVARAYCGERRQGGPPGLRPITIDRHPDVQRQLLEMISKLEVLRGLGLLLGVQADLARHDPDERQREDAAALVAFLLPIYKTLAGGAGFELASDAIQVLGGAGYTDQWPVEQALRDGRVATIYEGTTGMQALDLLHRRLWHDGAAGLVTLLTMVRNDLVGRSDDPAMASLECCAILERTADRLEELRNDPPKAEAGATAFLELAGLATLGWIAARLCVIPGEGHAARELRVTGAWFSRDLVVRCTGLEHRIAADAACGELFDRLSGHLEPKSAVRPEAAADA
jgi:3-(methylthio)propanoyl-CoA dehydrogenase